MHEQRVGDLNRAELRRRLAGGTLRVGVGPFRVWLQSPLNSVVDLVALLYAHHPLADPEAYRDFLLSVHHSGLLRRWLRPSVRFEGDGEQPFAPAKPELAFPLLEWGFNWRVATTAHQYLMLHAAVVERDGVTLVMPATPGSGKSTLAAALMHRGWRLLSDEFGLVRPVSADFVPFPRPIPLKNESIGVLEAYAADAVLGPVFRGTRKGDVAHCRPTRESVLQADRKAAATHVVFPRFTPGAGTVVQPFPKAQAFLKLSSNSFNYDLMGEQGFLTVAAVIEQSDCLSVVYHDLEEVVRVLGTLPAPAAGEAQNVGAGVCCGADAAARRRDR